jgi:plastocyanin
VAPDGRPSLPWGVLVAGAALVAGCGGEEPATQTLTLRVVTKSGVVEFDKKRLSAGAGRIEFELINEKRKGHNIRIHTGDVCCFRPGSKDIGGTRTIGTGRTRAIVDLEPGIYTYLCSTGGYWRTQHGTLVVR